MRHARSGCKGVLAKRCAFRIRAEQSLAPGSMFLSRDPHQGYSIWESREALPWAGFISGIHRSAPVLVAVHRQSCARVFNH
jgi:hypothetical protein